LLLVLAFGCGESPVTQPDDADPAFAKGGGSGVSVTATDPSYGKQGTVELEVRVLGSGFDQGSRASWERNGAPDPKVTVTRTVFVGASELRATIDIAAEADIDLYDVAVYTLGGRKGVGTEKFEVTAATAIGRLGNGVTSARGVNEQGHVVGASAFTGEGAHAFFWSAETGMQDIGLGNAWDIDQAGLLAAGGQANAGPAGTATLYSRDGTGQWTSGTLPTPGYAGGAARAIASDASGNAALIAGVVRVQVSRKSTVEYPALWTRSGTAWMLSPLPVAGFSGGIAYDVTPGGLIAGRVDGGGTPFRAAVWEQASSAPAVLPTTGGQVSEAFAAISNGLLVAGRHNGAPAIWFRTAVGGVWTGPVLLEGSGCGGYAYDVNDVGTIVGQACGEPVAWRVSGGAVLSRARLGGLGPGGSAGSSVGWVEAINASGFAAGSSRDIAATWSVP
jgi:probable HAF family extracellular repeat protein